MPRIRPLKTKEEIDAVPIDQPVTIALEPEGTVILGENADDSARKAQDKGEGAPPPKKKPEVVPAEDEEKISLKKQLDEMRQANAAQLAEANRLREQAERRAFETDREAARSRTRAEDAEYDAILNAIGAAETEAETAQGDIARATEASDPKGVADASRRLARAESRLAQLEDGKTALEQAKANQARQAKEAAERPAPQQQANQTPEQYIDNMPNLLVSQRDWLKAHPELVTNPNKNLRLQGAHAEAVDMDLKPGTQKYFDHLEMRLGYRKDEAVGEEEEETPVVSAPPSRQATSAVTGKPSSTRITLTPEQREMARLSGISEIDYAKGLQRLAEAKANGQYN